MELEPSRGLGVVLVLASMCWFKFLHWALSWTRVPTEVGRTGDGFKVFRYRNLVVSLCHAAQSGALALVCVALSWAEMRRDLLEFCDPLSFALVAFSTGYFVHDTLDIVLEGKARAKWDILVHHSCILGSAVYTLGWVHAIGYHAMAMLIEVNTVFLHARKLLQVSGWPRSAPLVRLNRQLNLGTFVVFRFGPLAVLGWAAVGERARLPLPFLLFFSLAAATLVLVNLVLFWRLAVVDLHWGLPSSSSASAFIRGHVKNDSMAGLCGSLTLFEDNPDPGPLSQRPSQARLREPKPSFSLPNDSPATNGLRQRPPDQRSH